MTAPFVRLVALCAAGFGVAASATAQEAATPSPTAPGSRLDRVQVTATRFLEQAQEVPSSVSVITADDMAARGVTDLRTALSLLGGVTVAPGGDAGPAGAVPGLLGQREVDDLLLLIDGVPAGGAFIPQFEVLSLVNVERIEVLRGTAPVFFGTTAFAGTINVVHYPAGSASHQAQIAYGSHGSASLSAATALSQGPVRQSIAGEISKDRYDDSRAGVKRAIGSYRLATDVGGGELHADFNVTYLRQKPASPTPVGDDGRLTTELPADFNQNPAGAKLDTDRLQANFGYERKIDLGGIGRGQWGTSLSLTHTTVRSLRGFLGTGGGDDDPDHAKRSRAADDDDDPDPPNAAGARQSRRLNDIFFDTHLTSRPLETVWLTVGLNELYGRATQTSRGFVYTAPLDGSAPMPIADDTFEDPLTLTDHRSLFGIYSQARWRATERLSLLAGLRWNHTREARHTAFGDDSDDQSQTQNRWSGSLGAQFELWRNSGFALDDLLLHASVGNTFQLPQIDFGPEESGAALLKPETERSVEFGLKADGLEGRLDADLSVFVVDFMNQTIATEINGQPALAAAGTQRFRGVELETSYRPLPGLSLAGHASINDATYRNFTTLIDGDAVNLAGKRLVMSPRTLAGASVAWAPAGGWRASLTANRIGARYFDSQNAASAAAFTIIDASIGIAVGPYIVSLSGNNLSNRRDPILASELGEGQFYREPGRRLVLSLTAPL